MSRHITDQQVGIVVAGQLRKCRRCAHMNSLQPGAHSRSNTFAKFDNRSSRHNRWHARRVNCDSDAAPLANVAVALGRKTVAPNPSPDAVTAVEVPVEVGTGLRQAVQRWHGLPLAVRSPASMRTSRPPPDATRVAASPPWTLLQSLL